MGHVLLANAGRLLAAPTIDTREVKWSLKDIGKLLGLFLLYQLVASIVFDLALPFWRLDTDQEKQLRQVLATWSSIALLLWTHARYRWWPNRQYFGLTASDFRNRLRQGILYGLVIKAVMIASGALVIAILAWLTAGEDHWLLGTPPSLLQFSTWNVASWFRCFDAVVVAPVVEELVFRGMFYACLANQDGITTGRVVSSLIFAALHGSVAMLIPVFLVGLGMVLIYERTRSLAPCVIAHATGNLISAVLAIF